MQFYWSWKKLPELQGRTRKEYLQVMWQIGLKPYRHLQLWLVISAISLVALLIADAAMENIFFTPGREHSDPDNIYYGLVASAILSGLLFGHVYYRNLRPYIRRVTFETPISWWGALMRGALVKLTSYTLFIIGLLAGMYGIDWAINCLDVSPDPRIAALKNWPEPIPDKDNGFIAMAGMNALPEADAFEVGRAYVAARNGAALGHAASPQWPEGLKYVGYIGHNDPAGPHGANEKSATPYPYEKFCGNRFESCWSILQNEHAETIVWLAANRQMLARYQSLQKYPRWQYAIAPDYMAVIPSYHVLIEGQRLHLASAMLEIERGQVGRGLGMIGDDIRFTRNILGSKETLVGKLIGMTLLTRDIALIAETLQARQREVRPYLAQIEKMLEPLSQAQISLADGFRYEEKNRVSMFERDDFRDKFNLETMTMSYDGTTTKRTFWERILDRWLAHDTRRYATANMLVDFWEGAIGRCGVQDITSTPPLTGSDATGNMGSPMGWWAPALNNGGKFIFNSTGRAYHGYQNRTYDLNALNNLVRLRVMMAEKNVSPAGAQAYLNYTDRTLWNPETGKPFEWDEKRNQLYFHPAEPWFKDRKIGGVEGRIGLSLM